MIAGKSYTNTYKKHLKQRLLERGRFAPNRRLREEKKANEKYDITCQYLGTLAIYYDAFSFLCYMRNIIADKKRAREGRGPSLTPVKAASRAAKY